MRLIRLLLAVLATALLARMILNARLFQYGYFQAAISAIMVPGVMLGEMPELLRVGKNGQVLLALGTLALFVPGVFDLASISQRNLSYKTVPVMTKAEPGDRLLAFAPEVDPTGQIVDHVLDTLSDASPGQTLLVLPQGVMLNFMLRLPGPNVPAAYSRSDEEERRIVDSLAAHPPDYVVLISTDLTRYGITRFGARPNEGGQILDWVKRHYDQISSVGGDPLDNTQRGAVVLRQKAEKDETGGT